MRLNEHSNEVQLMNNFQTAEQTNTDSVTFAGEPIETLDNELELWQARGILSRAIDHDIEVIDHSLKQSTSLDEQVDLQRIRLQLKQFQESWLPLVGSLEKMNVVVEG